MADRDSTKSTEWTPKGPTDYALLAADAAVTWWSDKRPADWSICQHIGNPTIGLTDELEKALAFAASNWAALYWGVITQRPTRTFVDGRYVDCPQCGKNVPVARSGYTWRHSGPDGMRHRVLVAEEQV